MPITFFGSAASPTDNGTSTATQITITPPTSMLAGDLVYVTCYQRGTATFSVGVDGGQTWSALTRATQGTVNAKQSFWCRFNGTWGANPRFDFSAGTNTNVVMLVFRPSSTSHVWEVDTAETNTVFTAPTTPFTVTVTGRTPANDNNVSIASWITADDNTWSSVAGTGWVQTNLSAQYRNTSGTDMSSTYAYQIQTTKAATNNASKNQTAFGGDAGQWSIVTFREFVEPYAVQPETIAVADTTIVATRQYSASAVQDTLGVQPKVVVATIQRTAAVVPETLAVADTAVGAVKAFSRAAQPETLTVADTTVVVGSGRSLGVIPDSIGVADTTVGATRQRMAAVVPETLAVADTTVGATRQRTAAVVPETVTVADTTVGATRQRTAAVVPDSISVTEQPAGATKAFVRAVQPETAAVADQAVGFTRQWTASATSDSIVVDGSIIDAQYTPAGGGNASYDFEVTPDGLTVVAQPIIASVARSAAVGPAAATLATPDAAATRQMVAVVVPDNVNVSAAQIQADGIQSYLISLFSPFDSDIYGISAIRFSLVKPSDFGENKAEMNSPIIFTIRKQSPL